MRADSARRARESFTSHESNDLVSRSPRSDEQVPLLLNQILRLETEVAKNKIIFENQEAACGQAKRVAAELITKNEKLTNTVEDLTTMKSTVKSTLLNNILKHDYEAAQYEHNLQLHQIQSLTTNIRQALSGGPRSQEGRHASLHSASIGVAHGTLCLNEETNMFITSRNATGKPVPFPDSSKIIMVQSHNDTNEVKGQTDSDILLLGYGQIRFTREPYKVSENTFVVPCVALSSSNAGVRLIDSLGAVLGTKTLPVAVGTLSTSVSKKTAIIDNYNSFSDRSTPSPSRSDSSSINNNHNNNNNNYTNDLWLDDYSTLCGDQLSVSNSEITFSPDPTCALEMVTAIITLRSEEGGILIDAKTRYSVAIVQNLSTGVSWPTVVEIIRIDTSNFKVNFKCIPDTSSAKLVVSVTNTITGCEEGHVSGFITVKRDLEPSPSTLPTMLKNIMSDVTVLIENKASLEAIIREQKEALLFGEGELHSMTSIIEKDVPNQQFQLTKSMQSRHNNEKENMKKQHERELQKICDELASYKIAGNRLQLQLSSQRQGFEEALSNNELLSRKKSESLTLMHADMESKNAHIFQLEEKLNLIEATRQDELSFHSDKVSCLEDEATALRELDSIYKDKISFLEHELQRHKDITSSLETDIRTLHEHTSSHASEIEGLKNELQILSEEEGTYQKSITDLKQSITNAALKHESEVRKLENQNAECEATVSDLKCQLTTQKELYLSIREERDALNNDLDALQVQHELKCRETKSLKEDISQIQLKYKISEGQLNAENDSHSVLCTQYDHQFRTAVEKYASFENEIRGHVVSINTLQETIKSAASETSQIHIDNQHFQTQLKAAEELHGNDTKEISLLETTLEEIKVILTNSENQRDELTNNVEMLKTENDKLNREIETNNTKEQLLSSELTTSTERCEVLEDQLLILDSKKQMEVSTLSRTINDLSQTIDDKDTTCASLTTQIYQLKTDISNRDSIITNLEGILNETRDDVNTKKTSLGLCDEQIRDLKDKNNCLNENFDEQLKTNDILTQEVQQLSSKSNSLQEELLSTTDSADELQSKITQMEEAFQSASTMITRLEEEHDSALAQCDYQIVELKQMNENISYFDQQLSSANDDINTLQADNNSMSSDVNNLNQQAVVLTEKLENSENDNKERCNRIRVLESQHEELTQKHSNSVELLRNEHLSSQDTITRLTGRLASLQQSMPTDIPLSTDITVDQLQQQLQSQGILIDEINNQMFLKDSSIAELKCALSEANQTLKQNELSIMNLCDELAAERKQKNSEKHVRESISQESKNVISDSEKEIVEPPQRVRESISQESKNIISDLTESESTIVNKQQQGLPEHQQKLISDYEEKLQESDKESSSFRNKLNTSELSLQQLKQQMSQMESDHQQQLDTHISESQSIRKKNTTLQSSVNQAQQQLRNTESDCEDKLQHSTNLLNASIETHRRKNLTLESSLREAQQKMSDMESDYQQQLENSVRENSENAERNRKKSLTLEASLREAQQKMSDMESAHEDTLKVVGDDAQRELQASRKKNLTLESSLREAQQKITEEEESHREQLENSVRENSENTERNRKKSLTLEASLREAQQKMSDMESDHQQQLDSSLKTLNADVQTQLEIHRKRNLNLESSLRESQQNMSDMESDYQHQLDSSSKRNNETVEKQRTKYLTLEASLREVTQEMTELKSDYQQQLESSRRESETAEIHKNKNVALQASLRAVEEEMEMMRAAQSENDPKSELKSFSAFGQDEPSPVRSRSVTFQKSADEELQDIRLKKSSPEEEQQITGSESSDYQQLELSLRENSEAAEQHRKKSLTLESSLREAQQKMSDMESDYQQQLENSVRENSENAERNRKKSLILEASLREAQQKLSDMESAHEDTLKVLGDDGQREVQAIRKKSLTLEASLRESHQRLRDMESDYEDQLERSTKLNGESMEDLRKKNRTLESSLREAQTNVRDMESAHEDTLKVVGDDAQRELQASRKKNLTLESSLREAQQKMSDMESDYQQQLENSVRENNESAERNRKKSLTLELSASEAQQKLREMESKYDDTVAVSSDVQLELETYRRKSLKLETAIQEMQRHIKEMEADHEQQLEDSHRVVSDDSQQQLQAYRKKSLTLETALREMQQKVSELESDHLQQLETVSRENTENSRKKSLTLESSLREAQQKMSDMESDYQQQLENSVRENNENAERNRKKSLTLEASLRESHQRLRDMESDYEDQLERSTKLNGESMEDLRKKNRTLESSLREAQTNVRDMESAHEDTLKVVGDDAQRELQASRKKNLTLEASLREAQQKMSDMESDYQQQLENSVRENSENTERNRKKSITLEASLREAQQKMSDMESAHEDTLKVVGDDAQRELQASRKKNLTLEASLREAQQKMSDMESDYQQQLENSVRENNENAERNRKKSLTLEASLREAQQKMSEKSLILEASLQRMEQKMSDMRSANEEQLEESFRENSDYRVKQQQQEQELLEMEEKMSLLKSEVDCENNEEVTTLKLKIEQLEKQHQQLKDKLQDGAELRTRCENYLQSSLRQQAMSSAATSAVEDENQKLQERCSQLQQQLTETQSEDPRSPPWSPTSTELMDESLVHSSLHALELRLTDLARLQEAAGSVTTDINILEQKQKESIVELDKTLTISPRRVSSYQKVQQQELLSRDVIMSSQCDDLNTIKTACRYSFVMRQQPNQSSHMISTDNVENLISDLEKVQRDRNNILFLSLGLVHSSNSSGSGDALGDAVIEESSLRVGLTAAENSVFEIIKIYFSVQIPIQTSNTPVHSDNLQFLCLEETAERDSITSVEDNIITSIKSFKSHESDVLRSLTTHSIVSSMTILFQKEQSCRQVIKQQHESFADKVLMKAELNKSHSINSNLESSLRNMHSDKQQLEEQNKTKTNLLKQSLSDVNQKLLSVESDYKNDLQLSRDSIEDLQKKNRTLESSLREAQTNVRDMESAHEDTLKVVGDDAQRELQASRKKNLTLESSLREAHQKMSDMESDYQQQLENSVRENNESAERNRKKSLTLELSASEAQQKLREMESKYDDTVAVSSDVQIELETCRRKSLKLETAIQEMQRHIKEMEADHEQQLEDSHRVVSDDSQQQLQAFRKKSLTLETALREMQQKVSELESDYQQQLENSVRENNENTERNRKKSLTLEASLREAQQKMSDMESAHEDTLKVVGDDAQRELQASRKKSLTLESSLREAQQKMSEIESAHEQQLEDSLRVLNDKTQQQLQTYQKRNSILESSLQEARRNMSDMESDYQQQLDSSSRERGDVVDKHRKKSLTLESSLREAQQKMSDMESDYQQQLENSVRENGENAERNRKKSLTLESSLREAQQKMSDMESDYQQQLENSVRENGENAERNRKKSLTLEASLQQMEQKMSDMESDYQQQLDCSLKQNNETAEKDKSSLKVTLDSMKQRMSVMESEYLNQLESSNNESESHRKKSLSLETALNDMQKQISEMESTHKQQLENSLRIRTESTDEELQHHRRKSLALEQSVQKMKLQMSDMESDYQQQLDNYKFTSDSPIRKRSVTFQKSADEELQDIRVKEQQVQRKGLAVETSPLETQQQITGSESSDYQQLELSLRENSEAAEQHRKKSLTLESSLREAQQKMSDMESDYQQQLENSVRENNENTERNRKKSLTLEASLREAQQKLSDMESAHEDTLKVLGDDGQREVQAIRKKSLTLEASLRESHQRLRDMESDYEDQLERSTKLNGESMEDLRKKNRTLESSLREAQTNVRDMESAHEDTLKVVGDDAQRELQASRKKSLTLEASLREAQQKMSDMESDYQQQLENSVRENSENTERNRKKSITLEASLREAQQKMSDMESAHEDTLKVVGDDAQRELQASRKKSLTLESSLREAQQKMSEIESAHEQQLEDSLRVLNDKTQQQLQTYQKKTSTLESSLQEARRNMSDMESDYQQQLDSSSRERGDVVDKHRKKSLTLESSLREAQQKMSDMESDYQQQLENSVGENNENAERNRKKNLILEASLREAQQKMSDMESDYQQQLENSVKENNENSERNRKKSLTLEASLREAQQKLSDMESAHEDTLKVLGDDGQREVQAIRKKSLTLEASLRESHQRLRDMESDYEDQLERSTKLNGESMEDLRRKSLTLESSLREAQQKMSDMESDYQQQLENSVRDNNENAENNRKKSLTLETSLRAAEQKMSEMESNQQKSNPTTDLSNTIQLDVLKQLQDSCIKLKDENTVMKSQLSEFEDGETTAGLRQGIKALEEENEKLRTQITDLGPESLAMLLSMSDEELSTGDYQPSSSRLKSPLESDLASDAIASCQSVIQLEQDRATSDLKKTIAILRHKHRTEVSHFQSELSLLNNAIKDLKLEEQSLRNKLLFVQNNSKEKFSEELSAIRKLVAKLKEGQQSDVIILELNKISNSIPSNDSNEDPTASALRLIVSLTRNNTLNEKQFSSELRELMEYILQNGSNYATSAAAKSISITARDCIREKRELPDSICALQRLLSSCSDENVGSSDDHIQRVSVKDELNSVQQVIKNLCESKDQIKASDLTEELASLRKLLEEDYSKTGTHQSDKPAFDRLTQLLKMSQNRVRELEQQIVATNSCDTSIKEYPDDDKTVELEVKIEILQSEIDILKEQNKGLRVACEFNTLTAVGSQPDTLQMSDNRIKELENEITSLIEKNSILSNQLIENENRILSIDQTIPRESSSSLNSQDVLSQRELQTYREKNHNLESSLREMEETLSGMSTVGDTAQRELQASRKRSLTLEASLREAQQKMSDMESDYQQQLENSVKENNENSERNRKKSLTLEASLREAQQKLSDMESAHEDTLKVLGDDGQREVQAIRKKSLTLEASLRESHQRLRDMESDYEDQLERSTKLNGESMEDLRKKNRTLESSLREAQTNVRDMESAHEDTLKVVGDDAQRELQASRKKSLTLEASLREAQQKMSDMESDYQQQLENSVRENSENAERNRKKSLTLEASLREMEQKVSDLDSQRLDAFKFCEETKMELDDNVLTILNECEDQSRSIIIQSHDELFVTINNSLFESKKLFVILAERNSRTNIITVFDKMTGMMEKTLKSTTIQKHTAAVAAVQEYEHRNRNLLVSTCFEGISLLLDNYNNGRIVALQKSEHLSREKLSNEGLLTLRIVSTSLCDDNMNKVFENSRASEMMLSLLKCEDHGRKLIVQSKNEMFNNIAVVSNTTAIAAVIDAEKHFRIRISETSEEVFNLLLSTYVKLKPDGIVTKIKHIYVRELDALQEHEQSSRQLLTSDYNKVLNTLQRMLLDISPVITQLSESRRKSLALQSQLLQLEAASRKNVSLQETATIVEEAVEREFIELGEVTGYKAIINSNLESLLTLSSSRLDDVLETFSDDILSSEATTRAHITSQAITLFDSWFGHIHNSKICFEFFKNQIQLSETTFRKQLETSTKDHFKSIDYWFKNLLKNSTEGVVEICDDEESYRGDVLLLEDERFSEMTSIYTSSCDQNNHQKKIMTENESLMRNEIAVACEDSFVGISQSISSKIESISVGMTSLRELELNVRLEKQKYFSSKLTYLYNDFANLNDYTSTVISNTIEPTEELYRTEINTNETEERKLLTKECFYTTIQLDRVRESFSKLIENENDSRGALKEIADEEITRMNELFKYECEILSISMSFLLSSELETRSEICQASEEDLQSLFIIYDMDKKQISNNNDAIAVLFQCEITARDHFIERNDSDLRLFYKLFSESVEIFTQNQNNILKLESTARTVIEFNSYGLICEKQFRFESEMALRISEKTNREKLINSHHQQLECNFTSQIHKLRNVNEINSLTESEDAIRNQLSDSTMSTMIEIYENFKANLKQTSNGINQLSDLEHAKRSLLETDALTSHNSILLIHNTARTILININEVIQQEDLIRIQLREHAMNEQHQLRCSIISEGNLLDAFDKQRKFIIRQEDMSAEYLNRMFVLSRDEFVSGVLRLSDDEGVLRNQIQATHLNKIKYIMESHRRELQHHNFVSYLSEREVALRLEISSAAISELKCFFDHFNINQESLSYKMNEMVLNESKFRRQHSSIFSNNITNLHTAFTSFILNQQTTLDDIKKSESRSRSAIISNYSTVLKPIHDDFVRNITLISLEEHGRKSISEHQLLFFSVISEGSASEMKQLSASISLLEETEQIWRRQFSSNCCKIINQKYNNFTDKIESLSVAMSLLEEAAKQNRSKICCMQEQTKKVLFTEFKNQMDRYNYQHTLVFDKEQSDRKCVGKVMNANFNQISATRQLFTDHCNESIGILESSENRCRSIIASQYRDSCLHIYELTSAVELLIGMSTAEFVTHESHCRKIISSNSLSFIDMLHNQFCKSINATTTATTFLTSVEKKVRKNFSEMILSKHDEFLLRLNACAESLTCCVEHEISVRNNMKCSEDDEWNSLRQFHEVQLTSLLDSISVIYSTECKSRLSIEKKQHLLSTQNHLIFKSKNNVIDNECFNRQVLSNCLNIELRQLHTFYTNQTRLLLVGMKAIDVDELVSRNEIISCREGQFSMYESACRDSRSNFETAVGIVESDEVLLRNETTRSENDCFQQFHHHYNHATDIRENTVNVIVMDEYRGRQLIEEQYSSGVSILSSSITSLTADEQSSRALIERNSFKISMLLHQIYLRNQCLSVSNNHAINSLVEAETLNRTQIENESVCMKEESDIRKNNLKTTTLYEQRAQSAVEIQFINYDEECCRRSIADSYSVGLEMFCHQSTLIEQSLLTISSIISDEKSTRMLMLMNASEITGSIVASEESLCRNHLRCLFKLHRSESQKCSLIVDSQLLTRNLSLMGFVSKMSKLTRVEVNTQRQREIFQMRKQFLLELSEMDHRSELISQHSEGVSFVCEALRISVDENNNRIQLRQLLNQENETLNRQQIISQHDISLSILSNHCCADLCEMREREVLCLWYCDDRFDIGNDHIHTLQSLSRIKTTTEEHISWHQMMELNECQNEEDHQRELIIMDNEPYSWSSLRTLAYLDRSHSAVEINFEEDQESRNRLLLESQYSNEIISAQQLHNFFMSEHQSRFSIETDQTAFQLCISSHKNLQVQFLTSTKNLINHRDDSLNHIIELFSSQIYHGIMVWEEAERREIKLLRDERINYCDVLKEEDDAIADVISCMLFERLLLWRGNEVVDFEIEIDLMKCQSEEELQRMRLCEENFNEMKQFCLMSVSVLSSLSLLDEQISKNKFEMLNANQQHVQSDLSLQCSDVLYHSSCLKSHNQSEHYNRLLIQNNALKGCDIIYQLHSIQIEEANNRIVLTSDMIPSWLGQQYLNSSIYDSLAKDEIELNWEIDREELRRQSVLLDEIKCRSVIGRSSIVDMCSHQLVGLLATENNVRNEIIILEETYCESLLRSHYTSIIATDIHNLTTRISTRAQEDVDCCVSDENTIREKLQIEEEAMRSEIVKMRLRFDLSKSQLMYHSCKAALDSHKRRIEEYKIATSKLQHLISADKVQYANVSCLGIGKPAGRLEVLNSSKVMDSISFMKDPFSVLLEKETDEREVLLGLWSNGIKTIHTLMVLESMQSGALKEQASPKRWSRSPGRRKAFQSPSRRGSSPSVSRSGHRSVSPTKVRTTPIPPRPAWVHAPGRATPPPVRPTTPRNVLPSPLPDR